MTSGAVPSWQPSLLDSGEPSIDTDFTGLHRRELDERSWIELVPRWVAGADALFDALLELGGWRQRDRWMYDKRVEEPRLTSSWRREDGTPIHPLVGEMRDALSARYGVTFDSGGLNLYRDGRDSVAWHGDRIPADLTEPFVAIVSLGHPRAFRLRRKGGGKGEATREVLLQRGDLLVTGGRCQREWDHSIPKVAAAGPRMSITFRHSEPPR
jgi:alkylated DNA repair dioxygenase AlkB